MLDFKAWYEAYGQPMEDEVREWIDNAPEAVEVLELIGEPEAYVQDLLQTAHSNYLGDYTDHLFEEQRDRDLMSSHSL